MKKVVICILLTSVLSSVLSQSKPKDINQAVEDQYLHFLDSLQAINQPIVDDSTMLSAYRSLYIFQTTHQKNVFEWQYRSSIIIFWVVLIILFSGLALSIVQFILSYKNINKKIDTATEMKLSPTELSVKSSVLGIIILIISIVFFYLYLTIVYPISFVK